MKYIKYIAAALLLTASLASCETGGVESGTPGNTTVQFAAAEVKDGFGAGVVYVPLTIESDTKEGMNSCSVQAKLKVVTTGEKFEGTPDTDGLSGDYRITSLDVNFPAFDNYYDDKNPEEYKDSETGKWVKKVQVEVLILNDAAEELHFTLEIESATTTIGEQKQCTVVLEKTARDRMCGNYALTCDQLASAVDASITWDGTYQCFNVNIPSLGLPLYTYYDEENVCMVAYPFEALAYADAEGTIVWYSSFYTDWENKVFADDYIVITYDAEAGTLTFPSEVSFIFTAYAPDADFNPATYMGRLSTMAEPYTNMVMTKK